MLLFPIVEYDGCAVTSLLYVQADLQNLESDTLELKIIVGERKQYI